MTTRPDTTQHSGASISGEFQWRRVQDPDGDPIYSINFEGSLDTPSLLAQIRHDRPDIDIVRRGVRLRLPNIGSPGSSASIPSYVTLGFQHTFEPGRTDYGWEIIDGVSTVRWTYERQEHHASGRLAPARHVILDPRHGPRSRSSRRSGGIPRHSSYVYGLSDPNDPRSSIPSVRRPAALTYGGLTDLGDQHLPGPPAGPNTRRHDQNSMEVSGTSSDKHGQLMDAAESYMSRDRDADQCEGYGDDGG